MSSGETHVAYVVRRANGDLPMELREETKAAFRYGEAKVRRSQAHLRRARKRGLKRRTDTS